MCMCISRYIYTSKLRSAKNKNVTLALIRIAGKIWPAQYLGNIRSKNKNF